MLCMLLSTCNETDAEILVFIFETEFQDIAFIYNRAPDLSTTDSMMEGSFVL